MRTLFVVAIVAVTSLLGTPYQAQASFLRGLAMLSSGCACTCCTCNCCTVMRTVQETVYEEKHMDVYHIKYKDATDTTKVSVVKYKDEKAFRCCPVTVFVLPQPENCAPAKTCAPAADCNGGNCGAAGCPELVNVQVCKKCEYATVHEVTEEKECKRPRLECEVIKEDIIICIPHVVCKQVPVQVCCPTPCCCHCGCGSAAAAPATSGCSGCGK